MTKKVVSEARIILPSPDADIMANIKIALTCPNTPDKAFRRPKLIPLFAANITEGPTLTEAITDMLR